MNKVTEFESAHKALQAAVTGSTSDDVCVEALNRRHGAANAVLSDSGISLADRLKVARIHCADLDHAATLDVIDRLAA